MTGEKRGRLTAIRRTGSRHGSALWLCKCECGGFIEVSTSSLNSGNTKSCGCLHKEQLVKRNKESVKHGYADKERLYNIWHAMRQRCIDPNRKDYPNYGGRGISICSEWDDYETFRNWALSNGYADDLSIDRINNNGNYKPENCRWVDAKIQAQNRRKDNVRRSKDGTYKRAN